VRSTIKKNETWMPNNKPSNDYDKLAVWLEKGQKKALVNYTAERGTNLTTAMRRVIDRLLKGEIDLNFATDKVRRKK